MFTGLVTKFVIVPVMLVLEDGQPIAELEGKQFVVRAGQDFDLTQFRVLLERDLTPELARKAKQDQRVDYAVEAIQADGA